jgi:hypothetical protein
MFWWLLVIGLTAAAVHPAEATCYVDQPAPTTKHDEDLAIKLQGEGDTLFTHKSYTEALERYRAALGAWDHAKLHLALGVAYIQLSQWVEATDELEWPASRMPRGCEAKRSARGATLRTPSKNSRNECGACLLVYLDLVTALRAHVVNGKSSSTNRSIFQTVQRSASTYTTQRSTA